MAMLTKFNSFVEVLAEKGHKLDTDTLKIVLSNTLPVATNAVLADITQIAASNGYVTDGFQSTQVSSSQSSGTYRLVINDVEITASGGSLPTFQYVVLYNDTATNDELIGWLNFGSPVTIPNGSKFLTDFDQVNGVLTFA